MRKQQFISSGFVLACILMQATCHAQEQWQSPQELQRIREARLLEWHAQEQARLNPEQHTSSNQPYFDKRDTNIQAAPEADDLFAAAVSGNVAQISRLLSQGLDINVSNHERETALHMAAARGHHQVVIYLVKKGAYVNAPTVKKWIPLHHAVRFRHPNIVNFLLKRGSSPHARTSDGLSAIDMANNLQDYRLLSILGVH